MVDVQHLRRQGVDPKAVMPLPALWENLTIDEIAEAVRDEWPGTLHQHLSEVMFADGFNIDLNVVSASLSLTCDFKHSHTYTILRFRCF